MAWGKKLRILIVFLRVKRWDLMNKTEISADMSYLVENIFVYFLQLVHQWPSHKEDPGVPMTPLVNHFLSY